MNTFDETLEHEIFPKSLERPLLYKYQYLDYFRYFHEKFRTPIKRTVYEVVEFGDHIVIHMAGKGESVRGHEYKNEYMVVLRMMASSTGDGSRKIRSVKEFVDSSASNSFFHRLKVDAEAEEEARAAAIAQAKAKSPIRR